MPVSEILITLKVTTGHTFFGDDLQTLMHKKSDNEYTIVPLPERGPLLLELTPWCHSKNTFLQLNNVGYNIRVQSDHDQIDNHTCILLEYGHTMRICLPQGNPHVSDEIL